MGVIEDWAKERKDYRMRVNHKKELVVDELFITDEDISSLKNKIKQILEDWKYNYTENGCKTSDGMKVIGFDETDWELLLKEFDGEDNAKANSTREKVKQEVYKDYESA